MKRISKILCVILAFVTALFAGGCGYVSEEELNSRLDGILSNIQDAFGDIETSSSYSPSEDIQQSSSSVDENAPPDFGDLVNGSSSSESSNSGNPPEQAPINENGSYTSKEDVALYIHTYGKLPKNFMTKKEAQALGWTGGSLEPYAAGMCIGGDYFGNNEGLLPKKAGRQYTECDIDTLGAGSRGAKRIVFSNDGLVYYTEDHYESFTLLYGEE